MQSCSAKIATFFGVEGAHQEALYREFECIALVKDGYPHAFRAWYRAEMSKRVVVMPIIACTSYSGSIARANLEHTRYSLATWTYWCRQNGVDFVSIQDPLGGEDFQDLPPTFQKWLLLERLIGQFGGDATFAFVDADTMIRWDTPNIFELAGDEFTAVKDWHGSWIHRSIRAFQPFFPDTRLNWWEYFNSGMVIMNGRHLDLMRSLTEFVLTHKRALLPLFNSWQVGDDQTPLNFVVKRSRAKINFLDARFNMIHCMPVSQELFLLETQGSSATVPIDTPVDIPAAQLDFIEMGYIWHFTNVVRTRSLVMARIWKLISAAYETS